MKKLYNALAGLFIVVVVYMVAQMTVYGHAENEKIRADISGQIKCDGYPLSQTLSFDPPPTKNKRVDLSANPSFLFWWS